MGEGCWLCDEEKRAHVRRSWADCAREDRRAAKVRRGAMCRAVWESILRVYLKLRQGEV